MHHVLFNVLYDISTLLVNRDCRKPCFGAKRTEIGEKTRKIGKFYFLHDFPSSTNVKEFSMYISMPCLRYQTFKSKEVAKPYILWQNMRKIEVKSRKIEKSHSLYNFLSKWCIMMHHMLFNVLYDISTLLVIRYCRKPCFGAKRTEIGEKITENWKLLFSVWFSFFNEC